MQRLATGILRQQQTSFARFYSPTRSNNLPTTMKLRTLPYYSTAFIAVGGATLSSRFASAWVSSLVAARATTRSIRMQSRFSTVAPSVDESADPAASSDTPSAASTTVSEGTIVARFPGGLTAVRLTDGDARIGSDGTNAPITLRPSLGGAITSFDLQGRNVLFPDGTSGVVVAHRPPVVFVLSDGGAEALATTNGLVRVQSDAATISVSPNQRIFDLHGKNLHEENADCINKVGDSQAAATKMTRPIFATIPQVKDISLINKPMLTGVTMMDSLAPIGKGQNMLMIGHDLNAMRGYVMDCLETQVREDNVKIIYATTENERTTLEELTKRGIEKSVHIVAPTRHEKDDASKAAEAVAIASAACSVAEMYAIEHGMDALVVVDTIDLHKQLWDISTRVLVDVFGVDAVVEADRTGGASSEMRVFFSSLVQRSAQYKESRGGGSVTLLLLTSILNEGASADTVFSEQDFAQSPEKIKLRIKLLTGRSIPLTAANLRKVDIPIPSDGSRLLALQHVDELISMSDGQIWLDERLESQGQWPPMNPQRSVTRIGIGADTDSRADAPALRRLDGRFRLDLSQAFNMVGADETAATKRQVQRKDALLLAMHQMPGAGGRRLSESCVLLLAATTGILDAAVASGATPGSDRGERAVKGLLKHVLQSAPDALATIDQTLDMTDKVKEPIMAALNSYSV
ncbi:hypothetical protein MPSEU_000169200 [Mayamaea pseudoterrestris]|nr:hypothetical protein MPSEU_000169200 [Mayamaea pseudoterrestris]